MKARPPPPRPIMSGGGVPKGRAAPSPLHGTRERKPETVPADPLLGAVPALPHHQRRGDCIVGARLASPLGAPALRFALTADRASLALFGRHEQIPRLAHFAASPLTLSLVQIPPHGYALQADVGGWWSGEAVHAPIGAGRDDLLVRRDHVPKALLVVAADLSGLWCWPRASCAFPTPSRRPWRRRNCARGWPGPPFPATFGAMRSGCTGTAMSPMQRCTTLRSRGRCSRR